MTYLEILVSLLESWLFWVAVLVWFAYWAGKGVGRIEAEEAMLKDNFHELLHRPSRDWEGMDPDRPILEQIKERRGKRADPKRSHQRL